MKTFQLKVLACFLMVAIIFAACEQETIVPTQISDTLTTTTNKPVGAESQQSGSNTIPDHCGGIHTSESLLHSEKITELARSSGGSLSDRMTTTFSVQFHVIRSSNGTGGTTQAIIDQRLNQLNQAFAPTNIQFERCNEVIFDDRDSWHIPWAYYYDTNNNLVNDAYLYAYYYNVPNVINVFIPISMGGCCPDCIEGLGTYPDGNASTPDYISVGLDAFVNKPDVFIHEMGHFFDLYHTQENQFFGYEDGNNCYNTGDRCCDTPADPGLTQNVTTACSPCGWDNVSLVNSSCQYVGNQSFTDSGIYFGCSVSHTGQDYSYLFPNTTSINPSTNNYMSYAPSACRNSFTGDQINRINAAATFQDRVDLVCPNGNGGGDCDNDPVFSQYPLASSYVDENNCTSEKITVYSKWNIDWLFIETPNSSKLYRTDTGQLWCTNSASTDCLTYYSMTNQIAEWECCDEEPECDNDPVFSQYPLASSYVDENNCTSEKITVYNKWNVDWLFIETPNSSKLYRTDTGQLWCTNSASTDCLTYYGMTNQIAEWECCD